MGEIILVIWNIFCRMAPYLLVGFLVAGLLKAFISTESIQSHLSGRGFLPIVKASLFGIPLPICSCGVIPVCASLRKRGASKGAATAFIISTPQTGVDSIFVTYSLLGGIFAILRPLSAFLSGLVGGILVDIASEKDDAAHPQEAGQCMKCGCKKGVPLPLPAEMDSRWMKLFRHSFVELPRDMAMPLITGTIVAGLISALLPDDIFARFLGTGISSLFLMGLMGIPVYVCATASVPVAAALMAKGVSPGAALVFLMTGPATNAAAIVALNKMIGAKATAIYMATVGVTAIIAGLAVDALLREHISIKSAAAATVQPGSINMGIGLILLVILVMAWVTGLKNTRYLS